MSRTTATETTSSPALAGRYGAIGIVAVSAALMFTDRADRSGPRKIERANALPAFAPIADDLHH